MTQREIFLLSANLSQLLLFLFFLFFCTRSLYWFFWTECDITALNSHARILTVLLFLFLFARHRQRNGKVLFFSSNLSICFAKTNLKQNWVVWVREEVFAFAKDERGKNKESILLRINRRFIKVMAAAKTSRPQFIYFALLLLNITDTNTHTHSPAGLMLSFG